MKKLLPLLFLLPMSSGWANTEWMTFENTDKTKSFVGRVVGFDSRAKQVTVQKQSSMRPIRFKVALLSEEHQEFVQSRAMEFEAAAGLRMMFFETIEKVGSQSTDKTKIKNYNGGYRIQIRNQARMMIEDVEVDYIIVYRKDAVSGNGEVATMHGSKSISTIVTSLDENVIADGVPLQSYYEEGKVSSTGGST